jgi:hypothetical protein
MTDRRGGREARTVCWPEDPHEPLDQSQPLVS